jgi:hypothetical protein
VTSLNVIRENMVALCIPFEVRENLRRSLERKTAIASVIENGIVDSDQTWGSSSLLFPIFEMKHLYQKLERQESSQSYRQRVEIPLPR